MPGIKTKELLGMFQYECDKNGILYRMDDIIKSYKQGYGNTQLRYLIKGITTDPRISKIFKKMADETSPCFLFACFKAVSCF